MVRVGLAAPSFDCQAVIDGRLVPVSWRQVHENKRLVLLFDSIDSSAHAPDHLLALSSAVPRLRRLHAKLAVVCRDPLYEVLAWANRPRGAGGPGGPVFPLIVDSDDRVAWLYDLMPADGALLWGRFLIDRDGTLREMAVSSVPLDADVEELVRSVRASWAPPLGRAPWN
jgi:alkyl hydroperoxide reductase subunit AhpC